MACSLATVQTDACTSGIGKLTDRVQLLQVIAQLSAETLVVAAPGTVITPAAILDRACTSGIGKVEDPLTLLRLIAQSLCEAA